MPSSVRLPDSIMDFCKYLGSMTTPLSMIFIGIVISRVQWRSLRLSYDLILVVVLRFVVIPGSVFLVVRGMDLPGLAKQVFVIQASMPAMTQTPIMAESLGADAEYAGLGVSLTTVLSLVTIPLYMSLVGGLL